MNKNRIIFNLVKHFVLILLCLPFYQVTLAQINWYRYDWSSQTKSSNRDIFNYAYNYCLSENRNNLYIGELIKKFSLETALETYDAFNTAEIYTNLVTQENYIKKVLNVIIKDTSLTNKIKICFYRNDQFGASMNSSGFLFLNIGILSRLDNEAELALLLGHEYAHFYYKDAIKNYGKTLELKYMEKGFSYWGAISYNENIKNYYRFSKDQESSADLFSSDLISNSPYSLLYASNILRKLKRIEIRNEIRYKNNAPLYSTHPDPGDRLTKIKKLGLNSSEKDKKKFVVDSMAFMELKEMCYNETVNIGLVNNNIDELITLCFSRYLLQPTNTNNLAVLIECLRRKLLILKGVGVYDKSFILDYYQTKAIKESENFSFLNEKKPSILNYLNKGFIDLWKEDFDQIKAEDLKDSTIIEFTTNLEAYLYFKEKAKSLNNLVLQHYNYFGKQANYNNVEEYCTKNNVFATNDLLLEKGVLKSSSKNLVLIIPPNALNIAQVLSDVDLEDYLKGNNLLFQDADKTISDSIVLLSDLDGNEIHLVTSLIRHCNFYLSLHPSLSLNPQYADWTEFCPELYTFFKLKKIQNLFIYNLRLEKNKNYFESFYKVSIPNKKWVSFAVHHKKTTLNHKDEKKIYPKKITQHLHKLYKQYTP